MQEMRTRITPNTGKDYAEISVGANKYWIFSVPETQLFIPWPRPKNFL